VKELRVLGDVDLRGTDGNRVDSIVGQPKSLALLAYLCLAARGRPHRRDLLISVFWPELSESNARNALNQSLHRLRLALGSDTVRSHGISEVEIDRAGLSCDALDFLEASDEGELETALDLYRGDLLAGLFVSGSPDFERWLDGERTSFRRKAFDGALKLGRAAEDRDDLASAERWYERAMVIIPERGTAVRHQMTVLARTGNAAEAVQLFDRFAARLAEEYGLEPSEETRAVVESIRSSPGVHGKAPDREMVQTQRATAAAHGELSATTGTMSTTLTAAGPRLGSRSRRWLLLAIPILGILIVLLWPPSDWFDEGPLQITVSNMTHVTSEPGIEFQPAISPDGNEVAYVEGPIGEPRIVVRSATRVGGGVARPGGDLEGKHWLPAWTSDGASVRFWDCWDQRAARPGCGWKETGRLGGVVQAVSTPRQSSHFAWSPDGTRVAFAAGDSIFAYSVASPVPELVGVQVVAPASLHSLAWSPDGRWITYVNGNALWRSSANVSTASIWIVDSDGGEPVAVTDEVDMNLSPQWLPDSRHLLFVSDRAGARGVYVVGVGHDGPSGPPRSVFGFSDPHSISISRDGRKLAYAQFSARRNIWSIPIPRSESVSIHDAVPVTEGNQVIESHGLSADGDWLVFDNNVQGKSDIYRARSQEGPHEPELVAEIAGNAFAPDWSPDGSEIAFYSWRPEGVGGQADILIASADGGIPVQVTDFPGVAGSPDWSPDGLSIAFPADGPDGVPPFEIWIVSRNGVGMPWSEPVQLTDFACTFPDWAPDGESLLCRAGAGELVRLSTEGEVLVRYGASTAGLQNFLVPYFSHDGSRIYVGGTDVNGSQGVWWIPSGGGHATEVIAFDAPSRVGQIGLLSVGSEDLYLTISDHESDIWVVDLHW